MLKRILALLLASLLLVLPACAEEAPSPLYLLVSRDAQGNDTPVGSAVLFVDRSTLLTTVWATRNAGELYAVGAGGTLAITHGTVMAEGSSLALLTIAQSSPALPLELGESDYELTLLGHRSDGTAVTSTVEYPSFMPYGDVYALLYTAQEPLLPGSIILDSTGAIACLTLSAYGEGVNRYVAMTSDNIYAELTSAVASMPAGVSWVKGFTATPGAGTITVDWSQCDLSCTQDDCVIGIFFADNANPYFSYIDIDDGTSTDLCLTPGRTFSVWVQHAHGELNITAQRTAADALSVTVPEAQPFDQYDYQDHEFYLGAVPATEAAAALSIKVDPLKEITADILTDTDTAIFMQAASTYAVEENAECDLLVVLTTPEGYTFDYLGRFIFDTTLQTSDVWNVDITQMIRDYLSFNATGSMASGEYTLCYYLGGATGSTLTFTLE